MGGLKGARLSDQTLQAEWQQAVEGQKERAATHFLALQIWVRRLSSQGLEEGRDPAAEQVGSSPRSADKQSHQSMRLIPVEGFLDCAH